MEIHGFKRGIAIESIVANLGNLVRDGNRGEVGGAARAELSWFGSRGSDDLGLLLIGEHGVGHVALSRSQVGKVRVIGQHGHSSQLVVGERRLGNELHGRGQLQRAHLGVGECAFIDENVPLGHLQDGLVIECALVECIGADAHHSIGYAIVSHRSLEICCDKVAVACSAL